MPHYQKLYSFLFGKVTDAIEALEQNHGEQAKDILIRASCEAEDMYIDSDPEDSEYPTKPMSKELFETLLDKCCADRDSDAFEALCEQYPGLDERCSQEIAEEFMIDRMQEEREPMAELSQWMEEELKMYYGTSANWELECMKDTDFPQ